MFLMKYIISIISSIKTIISLTHLLSELESASLNSLFCFLSYPLIKFGFFNEYFYFDTIIIYFKICIFSLSRLSLLSFILTWYLPPSWSEFFGSTKWLNNSNQSYLSIDSPDSFLYLYLISILYFIRYILF